MSTGYKQIGTAASFVDSMNRANGPLGSNWVAGQEIREGGAPVAFAKATIAASVVDGLQCMKLSTFNNAVGIVQPTVIIPVQPIGLLDRSQFVQWTVVRHLRTAGVNNLFAGPTVLTTATSEAVNSNAYIFQLQTPVPQGTLIRRNGTVETGLSAAYAFVDGDILRITAVINPTNVTLQIFINGVLKESVVDSSGSRLVLGLPGLMATSLNEPSGNYVSEWRNFSCGQAA